MDMEFWKRVKEQISTQNTTQEWVAAKCGIASDKFRRWATRPIMPNADEAVAIARALGVSVEYLVTGSDASDPWLREHADFLRDCKVLEAADRFGSVQRTVRTEADILRASSTEARNASGA